MSYYKPAKTNHRRVRSELMNVAIGRLAKGSPTGRRTVEGVTHILKGATYLPDFDAIPLDGTVLQGLVTPKAAKAIDGKARGLRKGALWCIALQRAGIPVDLGYVSPTAKLPPLIDALVNAAAAAMATTLTKKDRQRICEAFGLPYEETAPAGWTDAHDVLCAQGQSPYDETGALIDAQIDPALDALGADGAALDMLPPIDGPAPKLLPSTFDLDTMIAAAVAKALAAQKAVL